MCTRTKHRTHAPKHRTHANKQASVPAHKAHHSTLSPSSHLHSIFLMPRIVEQVYSNILI